MFSARALAILPLFIVPALFAPACDDSSSSGGGGVFVPPDASVFDAPPPPPPPPPGCVAPKTTCGAACVDLQTDAANCGACGVTCADACVAGKCCGDGVRSAAEACDKTDFAAATCASKVAPGWTGQLTCTAACKVDTASCTTPATTYNALTGGWQFFDATTVDANSKGFNEAGFDGRYVYFSPYDNGVASSGLVTRYDTQGALNAAGSWSTFDVTAVDAGAKGFHGVSFDGRYTYFTPYYDTGATTHGIVMRHDTTASFTSAASWSKFDSSTVNGGQKGYGGSVFDGRFLYFAPYPHSKVTRVDTQADFTLAASWSSFDTTTVNAASKGFFGAAFDGRYIYLAPYDDGNGVRHGIVTRYDTQAAFGTAASWQTFDITTVTAGAKGFSGAVFDGRYMYLVPDDNGTWNGIVARYDTQAAFGTAASWQTFDVGTVNAGAVGFDGAVFDGRHIYFVPYVNNSGPSPVIARYDTQAAFATAASWSTFDLTTLNAGAKGYSGAAFDGKYLYLSPFKNGTVHGLVARFDAKSVSWLPKGWNASFY